MQKVNLNILVTVCVFIMTLAVPVGADTHYVSPGQSIQAAINAASNGDEIEVSPGTYYESATYSAAIDLMGKAVRLYSSSGPEVTTINGSDHYHVVLCARGEGPDTILEGFTITGGYAYGYGIQNYGAGMLNYINSSPTVTNCKFIGNSASTGGGGMYNYANSSPTVTNCSFSSNTAGVWGGGMNNEGSNPIVTNCTFNGNSRNGMCNFYSSPTVTNCTFNGNSYGGMYNYNSHPTVTNCILWGDSPPEIFNSSSSANVTYSDVEGGWSGIGNIDANPLFVDAAAGNLRLTPGSPCVDAGDNGATGLPLTDIDGNQRIYGEFVDMGAYELDYLRVHNITQDTLYNFIQPAIDNANNGDQIEVDAGVYLEAIDFKGKSVRLYSSGGPEVTTIDGTGNYHVVRCVSSEGPDTILEGFTITGGNANGTDMNSLGGGMYNDNSDPTVTNCTFTGNRAGGGAGMANQVSNPIVTNCTFSGNLASGFLGGFGGAMYNVNNSSPTLTNCTFSGNTASRDGGGKYNTLNSSPTLTNCTFSGNTASRYGGGMYNIFNSSPTATNCILWDDRPNEIVDGDIFSSSTVGYSDVQDGWFGAGGNNIDADPCFVNANNPDPNPRSLRLKPDSPCIDAGNNNASGLPVTDLDGHPRILDGDCNDTEVVDMGAYEFNYTYMGDLDYNCNVDFFDFSIFGRAWVTQEGDTNWDWACDMSDPPDDYIDWRDLRVLCNNWLTTP